MLVCSGSVNELLLSTFTHGVCMQAQLEHGTASWIFCGRLQRVRICCQGWHCFQKCHGELRSKLSEATPSSTGRASGFAQTAATSTTSALTSASALARINHGHNTRCGTNEEQRQGRVSILKRGVCSNTRVPDSGECWSDSHESRLTQHPRSSLGGAASERKSCEITFQGPLHSQKGFCRARGRIIQGI